LRLAVGIIPPEFAQDVDQVMGVVEPFTDLIQHGVFEKFGGDGFGGAVFATFGLRACIAQISGAAALI